MESSADSGVQYAERESGITALRINSLPIISKGGRDFYLHGSSIRLRETMYMTVDDPRTTERVAAEKQFETSPIVRIERKKISEALTQFHIHTASGSVYTIEEKPGFVEAGMHTPETWAKWFARNVRKLISGDVE